MTPIVAGWVRTPFHRAHKGDLVNVRPETMVASCIIEVISRLNINGEDIDDVIVGCAYPEGEQGYNIGRMAVLLSNLPNTVPGMTINRLCGSSMQATISAANSIRAGQGECYVVAGVESMSRVKRRGFNWSPHPVLESGVTEAYISMGKTAENVAKEYGISREDQELFAFESHMKASINEINNKHIVKVSDANGKVVSADGCIRKNTSIDRMSRLPLAFDENGTVTAATSSPLTDGAVAMIVCSEQYAERMNIHSMARIVAGTVTGVHPKMMGIGPISAGRKLSHRTGWKLSDVDLFEINEAFSSQSIATISELGLDYDIVNIHGGSIAIGHPLGASGARILGQAASLLESTEGSRAMALMCIGGGMGIGIAIERL